MLLTSNSDLEETASHMKRIVLLVSTQNSSEMCGNGFCFVSIVFGDRFVVQVRIGSICSSHNIQQFAPNFIEIEKLEYC